MGAFGLNASILDSANLAWKLGLVAKDRARLDVLLPTYSAERRSHAVRIIETSGRYLRFVCGSDLAVVSDLGGPSTVANHVGSSEQNVPKETPGHEKPRTEGASASESGAGTTEADLAFLKNFFSENGQFLLGTDCAYDASAVVAPQPGQTKNLSLRSPDHGPKRRACPQPALVLLAGQDRLSL